MTIEFSNNTDYRGHHVWTSKRAFIDKEMERAGYYLDSSWTKRDQARDAAHEISRPLASRLKTRTKIRRAQDPDGYVCWNVWVETEEQYEKRMLAGS